MKTPTKIPARTRTREERAAVAAIADPAHGFGLRYLERHDAFLIVIPHLDNPGGYTSTSFNSAAAVDVAQFIVANMARPESVPAIARLVSNARWDHRGTIDRLEGEVQTLRFRIMHLESDAAKPAPYSDTTALAVVGGAS